MGSPRTPRTRTRAVAERLAAAYPDAVCELDHRNSFELIVATILSAQTTDVRVNVVTPALFARYPDAAALAEADPAAVEEIVRSTGFYQMKTKSLLGMARALVDHHGGEVPTDLADLVTLPGVGRKTGNVVRSVGFGLPGLPVDTHVGRVTRRLGLTVEEDPVKVELELNTYLPRAEWGPFSLRTDAGCATRRGRRARAVRSRICARHRAYRAAAPLALHVRPRSVPARGDHPTLRGEGAEESAAAQKSHRTVGFAATVIAVGPIGCILISQPGSRHLVWQRSWDPPPGFAQATAPQGAVAFVFGRVGSR
jgi:endonuclease-3